MMHFRDLWIIMTFFVICNAQNELDIKKIKKSLAVYMTSDVTSKAAWWWSTRWLVYIYNFENLWNTRDDRAW